MVRPWTRRLVVFLFLAHAYETTSAEDSVRQAFERFVSICNRDNREGPLTCVAQQVRDQTVAGIFSDGLSRCSWSCTLCDILTRLDGISEAARPGEFEQRIIKLPRVTLGTGEFGTGSVRSSRKCWSFSVFSEKNGAGPLLWRPLLSRALPSS